MEWFLAGEAYERTDRLVSIREFLNKVPDGSRSVLEDFLATLERSITIS